MALVTSQRFLKCFDQVNSACDALNRGCVKRAASIVGSLKDDAKFLLLNKQDNLSDLPSDYNVFLFRPYPEFLQQQLNNGQQIEPIFPQGHLYQLK